MKEKSKPDSLNRQKNPIDSGVSRQTSHSRYSTNSQSRTRSKQDRLEHPQKFVEGIMVKVFDQELGEYFFVPFYGDALLSFGGAIGDVFISGGASHE